ncbi:MAG: redoxin domain-containing protein [Chloroflexota bacterium]|nr:MAG: redoxin domain-containing protein [Chloroflexota bacterium]
MAAGIHSLAPGGITVSELPIPAVGANAPAFSGQSSNGPVSLSDYVGQSSLVLFFYPKADTGG